MVDKVKQRALAEKAEQDRQAAQTKAYNEAAPRSMGTFKEKAPKPPAPAASKPMAKGGCVKRYADGGVTEGENANIDEDTRARAMAAMKRRMASEDDEAPAVAVKPRAAAKLLPPKDTPGPSGRERVNAAPSGRGAAKGSFRDTVAESRANEVPSPMGKNPPPRERSGMEEFGSKAMDTAKKALGPLAAGAGLGAGADKLYKMYKAAESAKRAKGVATQAAKRPQQLVEQLAAMRAAKRAEEAGSGMKKGGKVNCYAGGGSVKGAGIAQRGVKKCKVV